MDSTPKPVRRLFYNKFKNIRVEIDGIKFDSKAEGNIYLAHKEKQGNGECKIIGFQKTLHMIGAEITYRTDLVLLSWVTGQEYYVEAKGVETPEWKLKLELYRRGFFGDKKLEIWKQSGKKVKKIDEIYPPKMSLV